MREILFRGKRVDNGEWVEGGLCDYDSGVSIFVVNHYDGDLYEPPYTDLDEIEVVPETVGQYTGLVDKDNERIFTGDILKYTRKNCHNVYEKEFETFFKGGDLVTYLEIYYDDTCAAFKFRHYDENKKLFGSGFLIFNDSRADENILEIIGNIHDNPELLEEKKNVQ